MLILKSRSVKQAFICGLYVNKSKAKVLKRTVFVNKRNYSNATIINQYINKDDITAQTAEV